jgi:hypothetical protein
MRLALTAVFLVPALMVRADEPPSWSEFQDTSPNRKFVAKVAVKDKGGKQHSWEWSYTLSVYNAKEEDKKPLWSCDYVYDGYPDGYLADDGKTFTTVSFWYYNSSPVVSVYKDGKLAKQFKGEDFRIPRENLKKTVSHVLWLADDQRPRPAGAKELVIPTIDGRVFRVDLGTLEMKEGR